MLPFRLAYAAALGAPLLLAVAWWRWWWDDRARYPGWRAAALLLGLGQLTFFLILAALAGTMLGKGRGRLLALIATLAGFVLWLPIAF